MLALSPFEYTYDEAGLSSVKYPSGRTISYDFDLAGRVKSVTGTLAAATKTYISGIDYSAHGAIEEMTYGGATTRKQRYCYNNRLQMSGMVLGQNPASNCASADTTLMRLFMGYGAANNGNLESQDIAADGFLVRQNYTYDKLNRLETAIEATLPTAGSTGWKQTNGYDRWGNRWVSDLPADTYPSNLTAQANSSSWFTAKNRLNLLGGFDNAGNQTSANGFTLSYDAENRLTTAVHGTNTSKNQAYSYDAEGRRVKQVSGTSPVTLTTYFVYDAMGGLAAEYEVKTGEYPTPAAQCTTSYLAQDHLGSTRALWDDTGVKARFDYLPFGEAIPGDRNGRAALTCAAGVTNCYNGPGSLTQKFTGKERDAETGLDYFGTRYFSALGGRFTSPDLPFADQLAIEPQSWNLYAYVRGKPLQYRDRDGKNAVAAAISGAEIGTLVCGPGCTVAGAIVGGLAGLYLSAKAGEAIGQVFQKEQARTDDGKFAPKNPGETQPGEDAEKEAYAIIAGEGHNIAGTHIPVKSKGQTRVYDIVYTDKTTGETVGVEVKSGDATKTKAQKEFDKAVDKGSKPKPGPKAKRSDVTTIDRIRDIKIPKEQNGAGPQPN
jgi:RHS repeat-associated protein